MQFLVYSVFVCLIDPFWFDFFFSSKSVLVFLHIHKPLRIQSFLINAKPPEESDSITPVCYHRTVNPPHFLFSETQLFLLFFNHILFCFFLKNSSLPIGLQLFSLAVCTVAWLLVSCEEAEKLYLALSEWKCQEVCERKICLSLLSGFSWSFSPLLCQYPSVGFFSSLFFYLCIDLSSSSLVLFVWLFVLRRRECLCVNYKCLTAFKKISFCLSSSALFHCFCTPIFQV